MLTQKLCTSDEVHRIFSLLPIASMPIASMPAPYSLIPTPLLVKIDQDF
ncbi:MAG: hypothetical protein F6K55_35840 [Moorea sp. SIO4A3]|nr:hypothetical protein [Moorena sp. SIO4A3]